MPTHSNLNNKSRIGGIVIFYETSTQHLNVITIEKTRKKCYNTYVSMSSQIRLRMVRRNTDGIVPMALIHLLLAHISSHTHHVYYTYNLTQRIDKCVHRSLYVNVIVSI